jgi:hypothetical protein
MSQTVVPNPTVKTVGLYSGLILKYKNYNTLQTKGKLIKYEGFTNYNYLIDINSVFSTSPKGNLYDRTHRIEGPLIFSPERDWKVPEKTVSLEYAMQSRVTEICNRNQKINILWSGGIDSTAILVAFLKYAPDHQQLKVIYSPFSTYEHPDFYNLLQSQTKIELHDVSGDTYFDLNLDGIVVSGNTGDEMHASLDQSFFETYGFDTLESSWKDFFYQCIPNDDFIDFCEYHFSAAGRDIVTVLDARWWFYASTKLTAILNASIPFFYHGQQAWDPTQVIGFFDCDVYEQFIYFNTDKIIPNKNYSSWRQFLKDFCYSYDGFDNWRTSKTKFDSGQLLAYQKKLQAVKDSRFLFLLDNGTYIRTPNLPFFSQQDWEVVASQCDHCFNLPQN